MKITLSLFFVLAALAAVLTPRAAHAGLSYWSAALIGTWKSPETGAVYQFKSDATYTYTNPKPGDSRIVAESGWWKIAQPTEKESGGSQQGPVALIIKMRKVTFLEEHGLRHTESIKSDARSVVDTVFEQDKENPNLYRINGVNWKRVK